MRTLVALFVAVFSCAALAQWPGYTGKATGSDGITSTTATAPTMGACGTSPSVVGRDDSFTVTVGTGGAATACIINFGTAYANPPNCSVMNNTDKVSYSTVEAVGSLTINATAAFTAGSKFKVICKGFL